MPWDKILTLNGCIAHLAGREGGSRRLAMLDNAKKLSLGEKLRKIYSFVPRARRTL